MGSSDMSPADSLLASMKREWADMHDFYGNRGIGKRERWIVEEFLRLRKIPFIDSDLCARPQDDPVDIVFQEADFQVKEILDPGTRRTAEIRDTARSVAAAKSLEETLTPYDPTDVPAPVDGNKLILEEARSLAGDPRYIATKQAIDLLFYVTRTRTSTVRHALSNQIDLEQLGWRSVSVLTTDHTTVLYVGKGAPDFLVPGDIDK